MQRLWGRSGWGGLGCFNPHPARRPGATSLGSKWSPAHRMFQSSPGQKAGCNRKPERGWYPLNQATGFNPHPARRPGATSPIVVSPEPSHFQSSPGQKAGCNSDRQQCPLRLIPVSILTRPEGRVQAPPLLLLPTSAVSILTRPEGRVQPSDAIEVGFSATWFQSSPGQKAGCNLAFSIAPVTALVFQSSPGQKAGCNGLR